MKRDLYVSAMEITVVFFLVALIDESIVWFGTQSHPIAAGERCTVTITALNCWDDASEGAVRDLRRATATPLADLDTFVAVKMQSAPV